MSLRICHIKWLKFNCKFDEICPKLIRIDIRIRENQDSFIINPNNLFLKITSLSRLTFSKLGLNVQKFDLSEILILKEKVRPNRERRI